MDELISIKKAAKMLGVAQSTLREWDKNGRLKPIRTVGGHRRYRLADLTKIQSGEQVLEIKMS